MPLLRLFFRSLTGFFYRMFHRRDGSASASSGGFGGLVVGLAVGMSVGVAVAAVFVQSREFGFGVGEGDTAVELVWQGNGSGSSTFAFANGVALADIPNGSGNTLKISEMAEAYSGNLKITLRTEAGVAPGINVKVTLTDADDVLGIGACLAASNCSSVGRSGCRRKGTTTSKPCLPADGYQEVPPPLPKANTFKMSSI